MTRARIPEMDIKAKAETYHHLPLLFTARVLERDENAKTHNVLNPKINATGLIVLAAGQWLV